MEHIDITGGGLVGALWALYLGQQGYRVTVYEARPDPRIQQQDNNRSINLAMSERGLRALHQVGLEEQIKKIAIPMHGRMVHPLDGHANLQPYGDKGQYINAVSRELLNKLLVETADQHPNVEFKFQHKCAKIDLNQPYSTLYYTDMRQNQQLTVQTDRLFAADGAYSALRFSMQRKDGFNYSQQYLTHAYKELTIPPKSGGGFQLEKNALHIWPRKSFMLIALPNIDGSFTCTLFLARQAAELSFAQLQTPAQLEEFWQTYFPDTLPLMPQLADEFFANPTSSLITVRCNPWTYNHQIALLGDAAHAIVPFYGQGMNAGFEDCYVLNQLMANCKQKHGEVIWDIVLPQYETLRIPDANAIAELALQNFIEMRDLVTDEQFLLRKRIEKQLHQEYGNRYLPLYSMVTFSNLRYSDALRISQIQDRVFAGLLSQPQAEQQWLDGKFSEQLHQLVLACESAMASAQLVTNL